MNKSKRIYFNNDNESYIKLKLEQDVNNLEILSLNINSDDIYRKYNSDYGVLVGRVYGNKKVGIPNAKISIFIPLDDNDSDLIKSIYPYKNVTDTNNEGKRYNLLPRISCVNVNNNTIIPKQPIGSLPIKEEVYVNDILLEINDKYYKYSTVTNSYGDYMLFGLPVGLNNIHMSVDITDIGKYSMNPASMINKLGYSNKLFTDDKTKIIENDDISTMPNVELQDISVNIIPFWGDIENSIIGITRQDFNIKILIENSFTIFASAFTDNNNSMWGENHCNGSARIGELYRASNPSNSLFDMSNKLIGEINEKIYYYPDNITDDMIFNGYNEADPFNNMLLLDKNKYTVYKKDGDIVIIINCNRKKIITNDYGEEIVDNSDSEYGIYTQFIGFIVLEIDNKNISLNKVTKLDDKVEINKFRYRLKFPQHSKKLESFSPEIYNCDSNHNTDKWRNQNFVFCSNKYYTLSKFHPIISNNSCYINNIVSYNVNNGFLNTDLLGYTSDNNWNVGYINPNYENYPITGLKWMNISIHFPNLSKVCKGAYNMNEIMTSTIFSKQVPNDTTMSHYYVCNNNQKFVANEYDTSYFPRSDINWTDIIEIPYEDILLINEYKNKGFKSTDLNLIGTDYRNLSYIPDRIGNDNKWNSAYPNIYCLNNNDNVSYFYKGYSTSNVIEYMVDCLKII